MQKFLNYHFFSLNQTFRNDVEALLLRPALTRPQRVFTSLAAANALLLDHETADCIALGIAESIPVLQLKEVILQNYLFCGFPNAIEGLLILQKQARLHGLANEDFQDHRSDGTIRLDGERLCWEVYRKNFDKLMNNMQSLSTDLHQWMIREGYGKVLSRPVLPGIERELCIVSALAVLGRTRQLISHLKGAFHLGADIEAIRETILSLRIFVSQDHIDRTMNLLENTLE